MSLWNSLEQLIDYVLFASCLFILASSIYLSFKTKFIQIRIFSEFFKGLKKGTYKNQKEGTHTILPHRALFTAMSTTLGIGTIVGPIVAIRWGGPGALLGFLLTAFFGSAATYTEVDLSIRYRKKLPSGKIEGGPMQYLEAIFSKGAAIWYAVFASILMGAWSAAQANQLGAILTSPLLGNFRISTTISGIVLSVGVFLILIGGTKRVSRFSAKIVPVMFFLYLGAILWILIANWRECIALFPTLIRSAISPYAMGTGALTGGMVSALRWGIFKGTQATEAGVGTQAIPHSMTEIEDSKAQGILAMFSTFAAGIVSFLTGYVILVTNTWQDPNIPVGIGMLAASFQSYFSYAGVAIVAISTLLFAVGTILGNSYNGGHCFNYLTKGKGDKYYYLAVALLVFIGTVAGIKNVWSMIDISLAFLVVPHVTALLRSIRRSPQHHKKAYSHQD